VTNGTFILILNFNLLLLENATVYYCCTNLSGLYRPSAMSVQYMRLWRI